MIRERAALLVHDVVTDFLGDGAPTLPEVLANIDTLMSVARRAEVPIIFAAPGQGDLAIGRPPSKPAGEQLVWGTPGVDVPATLDVRPDDTIIRKPRFGAFHGTLLAQHLQAIGRDTVILCGLSLAGGVETTVRDAYNHDLHSIVVADACLVRAVADQGFGAVTREEVAKVTLSILAQRFARIVLTAEICDELTAPSATTRRRLS